MITTGLLGNYSVNNSLRITAGQAHDADADADADGDGDGDRHHLDICRVTDTAVTLETFLHTDIPMSLEGWVFMRVAEGSVMKRCGCRYPDRRRVGTYCPKLRRPDGSWQAHHGVWAYQLELPPTAAGGRRMLRRIPSTGSNSRQAALAERDHARDLIRLAGEDDHARAQVATVLQQVGKGRALPGLDDISRMLRLGDPDAATQTTGQYLAGWIADRMMDDNTRRGYAGHVHNHLIPFLGDIPLHRLKPWHVENMFAAIARRNAVILADLAAGLRRKATPGAPRFMGLSTMHLVRATLRKALNDAIRKHGLLQVNAASQAELPAADLPKPLLWTDVRVRHWQATGKIPSPVMVWTPQQSGQFLDHVAEHDPDLYPVFSLVIVVPGAGKARACAPTRSTWWRRPRRSATRSPAMAHNRFTNGSRPAPESAKPSWTAS